MSTESELLQRVPDGLFIGGEWRPAEGGRTLDVFDPATGERVRTIADATPADGMAALDAAVEAFPAWAATPARERAEILRRTFDLVQERREDFGLLMTVEMGKPLAEARGEVAYGAEFLRWFSEEAVRVSGRYGPNPEGTGRMIVSQHPVGPAFLITPWNFPLAMATRKIAPALAAGCTVVIKPAELTPLTTLLLASVLEEAGLPAGVVNVFTTSTSGAVSEPIIRDPRLRKLSFTGSTAVGKALLKEAAGNVLRTSMELGGNAPFIVFEDADIDKAVEAAVATKLRNMGEACNAADHFFVHDDVYDEFTEKFSKALSSQKVGDGTESGIDVGPLVSQQQLDDVSGLVNRAVEAGGSIETGGKRIGEAGFFFEPTVITNVAADAEIMVEEIFGPVAPVVRFTDEKELVKIINSDSVGLAGYFHTNDLPRILRLAEKLEIGMLGVNSATISNTAAPFGGLKQSGMGREGGKEGIEEYLETVYVGMPAPDIS